MKHPINKTLTFAIAPNTASSNVVKFADPATKRRERSGLDAKELALVIRGVEATEDANGGVTSAAIFGAAEFTPDPSVFVE